VRRQFCGIRRYFCMLIEMRSHLFYTFILIWYVQENKLSWAWLRDLNTEGQQTEHWILNSLRLYYRYSITSIFFFLTWVFGSACIYLDSLLNISMYYKISFIVLSVVYILKIIPFITEDIVLSVVYWGAHLQMKL
jgi:hypothetical protein